MQEIKQKNRDYVVPCGKRGISFFIFRTSKKKLFLNHERENSLLPSGVCTICQEDVFSQFFGKSVFFNRQVQNFRFVVKSCF